MGIRRSNGFVGDEISGQQQQQLLIMREDIYQFMKVS